MSTQSINVTVLIPTYDRFDFLVSAVTTTLNGSSSSKILIIDDDSPLAIKEQLLPIIPPSQHERIAVVRNVSNCGEIESLRIGLRLIDTEYFVILADDDQISEGFLDRGVEILNSDKSVKCFIGGYEIRDSSGIQREVRMPECLGRTMSRLSPACAIKNARAGKLPLAWSGFVFRTTTLREVTLKGWLDRGFGTDIDFVLHVLLTGDVIVSREIGVVYCHHDNTTTGLNVHQCDERFLYWIRMRFESLYASTSEPEIKRELLQWYEQILPYGFRKRTLISLLRFLKSNSAEHDLFTCSRAAVYHNLPISVVKIIYILFNLIFRR